jgi:uncharacterized protein YndB with AHSA1/START domain
MKKRTWSIDIAATPEVVWNVVLGKETYSQWTEVFMPGSYAEGDWSVGSTMRFLSPPHESPSGMLSTIVEHRPHEYLSIKHIGFISNGVEDTESDAVKAWTPSFENYRCVSTETGTQFSVEMDVAAEYEDDLSDAYPVALRKVKELAETGALKSLTVGVTVDAPLQSVWEKWTGNEHITTWCMASDDWHTPRAEHDVRDGGRFLTRMEAKDGSAGFDFTGTYTRVVPERLIEYTMDDGRRAQVRFMSFDGMHTMIVETFEKENENSEALQRDGWHAILTKFKQYVEATK